MCVMVLKRLSAESRAFDKDEKSPGENILDDVLYVRGGAFLKLPAG
jgi:hypothetical protein